MMAKTSPLIFSSLLKTLSQPVVLEQTVLSHLEEFPTYLGETHLVVFTEGSTDQHETHFAIFFSTSVLRGVYLVFLAK